jgi:hypothetical protein
MKESEEKEPAFKVVDRRRFTEQGEEKFSSDETIEPKEEKTLPPPVDAYEAKHEDKNPRPPMSFTLFIQYLANQTMMALGMIPWPDSGLVRTELMLAKETIDILHMLKEKTANNLSKDEDRLLETLVYQLKLAYIEVAKKPPEDPQTIIK